jgi:hypothetical protein
MNRGIDEINKRRKIRRGPAVVSYDTTAHPYRMPLDAGKRRKIRCGRRNKEDLNNNHSP